VFEAGLASRTRSGEIRDTFRERHMHPILERDGRRVLGFSGRTATDDPDAPKYLNTRETALYRKSETLYGWPNADAIRAAGEAFVVEGNVDMLALWEHGVRNVVALCGTALTSRHLRALREIAPRITLVLDADAAGQAATRESLTADGAAGFDLGVIALEGGKDPAAILARDPSAWAALASRRRTRWAHLWHTVIDPVAATLDEDVETWISAKDAWAALVVKHAADRAEGEALLWRLGERLHLDVRVLADEYLTRKGPRSRC
jgi:DNA primase catalytic core